MRSLIIGAVAVLVAAAIGFFAGGAVGGGDAGLPASAEQLENAKKPLPAVVAGPTAPGLKTPSASGGSDGGGAGTGGEDGGASAGAGGAGAGSGGSGGGSTPSAGGSGSGSTPPPPPPPDAPPPPPPPPPPAAEEEIVEE